MLFLTSVVVLVASANAVRPSCDPKALGASIDTTLPLSSRPGCLCVSNKGCERGKLEVSSNSFKYDGPLLGTWVGGRDEDHWNIKEPQLAGGNDLIPIKEGNNIVLVLCDRNKIFKDALVHFTERPQDKDLDDLKEKYDIEVGLHIANCGFE